MFVPSVNRVNVSGSSNSNLLLSRGCEDGYSYSVECLLGSNSTGWETLLYAAWLVGSLHRDVLGSIKSQWISRQSPTCSSPKRVKRVTLALFSLRKETGSSPSRCPHPYSTWGLDVHLPQPWWAFLGLPFCWFPLLKDWTGCPQIHHHLQPVPPVETLPRCLLAGR